MRGDSLTDMYEEPCSTAKQDKRNRYRRVIMKAKRDNRAKHGRRSFVCEI